MMKGRLDMRCYKVPSTINEGKKEQILRLSLISIIIPTYNERENLERIIDRIFNVLCENELNGEVIVVDDSSPDGTGKLADQLKKQYMLEVLHRKDKRGLSSAVLEGFKIADGDIIGVMDADHSHPPECIPKLVEPIKKGKADMAIGSRYISGGSIINWTTKRKIVSKCATLIARPLTNIKDPMSGFFFLKREVIEGIDFSAKGYKIGLEIIVKGNHKKVIEIPYTFRDREVGKSKLNPKEYLNYLSHALGLYTYKYTTTYQFTKFCIVGGFGALITLAILYTLVEYAGLWYILAASIAFVIAVINNFVWNKFWTFYDANINGMGYQFMKFFVISAISLGINLAVLYALVEYFFTWYILAQIIAIVLATGSNFIGNKFWTFHGKL
jgi:dolichol-phosphate mannosyltransferase